MSGGSTVLILPPSPALADRVLFYVARRRGEARVADADAAGWEHRFPANMYSTLSFTHSGRLLDPLSNLVLPAITASGVMSRPVRRRYVETPETTVVVFRPGALTDLVQLPAFEFSDVWTDAASLWSATRLAELGETVLAQRNVARRIHALERFLLGRFAAARSPAKQLAVAMQALVWQLPHMSVDELADRLGSHKRGLQRRFRDTFGTSPRLHMRLARLQLTLWHLQRRRHRLVEIASHAGYADAAHLAREVRALVGTTPSVLLDAMRTSDASSWALHAPQDALQPMPSDGALNGRDTHGR